MSLVSRVLVDDALEHVMRFVPTGERLALRGVSRQFNAVVKRDIKRHGRPVRLRSYSSAVNEYTVERVIEALFPAEQSQQWIVNFDIDLPRDTDSGRVGARLRYVRSLHVYGSAVQEVFYRELTSLQHLRHNTARAVGGMALASLTALRSLSLTRCSITDECLQNLSLLTSLELHACQQVTGTCFSRLGALQALSVAYNGIDHGHLTSLHALRWLYTPAWTTGSLGGGHQLAHLASTLTELNVNNSPRLALSSLSALTSLARLSLQLHDHERLTGALFAPFSALVDLDISFSGDVDDNVASELFKLTRLRTVSCHTLRNLTLQHCSSSLVHLDISGCTSLQSASLTSLTRLAFLDMATCTSLPRAEIRALLLCSQSLRALRIAGCPQIDNELVSHANEHLSPPQPTHPLIGMPIGHQ
jgi:hypothetical protein